MKRIFALIIATIMMTSTITATAAAAEPVHGASAGTPSAVTLTEAPAGYLSPETLVETPDGYVVEDEAVLGAPLVAYTLSYLDELALEKGYIVVETGGGKYRDYVHTEDGVQTLISFKQDFVTVCTHDMNSDMPGAIMGVQCYIDINCDVVYSTVDLTELF